VDSIRTFLHETESSIPLQWMALSGAHGPDEDLFDTVIRLRDKDFGRGLNLLVSAIRTPFVLWADRDWRFSPQDRKSLLGPCIEALCREPHIAQVKLHADDNLRFTDRSVYGGPICRHGDASFYIQSPRKIWGGITLCPAIVKLEALHALGPFREGPEMDWEDVAAEYCARSTDQEKHLVLRSPELAPFEPVRGAAYVSEELVVEDP
jgi:hypothetical protein